MDSELTDHPASARLRPSRPRPVHLLLACCVLAGTLLGSVLLGALVGVVTAFTGAPFFLVVLRAARRSA